MVFGEEWFTCICCMGEQPEAAYQVFRVIQVAMLSPHAAIRQLIQSIQVVPANYWAGLPILIYHVTLPCNTSLAWRVRAIQFEHACHNTEVISYRTPSRIMVMHTKCMQSMGVASLLLGIMMAKINFQTSRQYRPLCASMLMIEQSHIL